MSISLVFDFNFVLFLTCLHICYFSVPYICISLVADSFLFHSVVIHLLVILLHLYHCMFVSHSVVAHSFLFHSIVIHLLVLVFEYGLLLVVILLSVLCYFASLSWCL